MIYAAILDILATLWNRIQRPVAALRSFVAADIRRANRWLSAGALVDTWPQIDRSTGRIIITDYVRDRDGIDLSPAGLNSLRLYRSDVRVAAVFHDLKNSSTHLILAWRAAVLLLVLSLPVVVTAAPPDSRLPVSQIGPDDDSGFRLVSPRPDVTPIVPIQAEEPPPRPEIPLPPQSRGPTVPVDVIHRTLLDVLQMPEVAAAVQTPAKRRVRIHGASWCGYCQQEFNDWTASNDGSVEIEYTYDPVPDYVPNKSIPVNIILDAASPDDPAKAQPRFWNGKTSWKDLQWRLNALPAASNGQQLVGTITMGSIKGKSQVAEALRLLNQMGPGQMTLSWQVSHAPQIGTADSGLEIDGAGSTSYRWDADSMRLSFKPPLRLASKTWLGKVSQPVSGVDITRDKVTVELPGIIDLAKRLVE